MRLNIKILLSLEGVATHCLSYKHYHTWTVFFFFSSASLIPAVGCGDLIHSFWPLTHTAAHGNPTPNQWSDDHRLGSCPTRHPGEISSHYYPCTGHSYIIFQTLIWNANSIWTDLLLVSRGEGLEKDRHATEYPISPLQKGLSVCPMRNKNGNMTDFQDLEPASKHTNIHMINRKMCVIKNTDCFQTSLMISKPFQSGGFQVFPRI